MTDKELAELTSLSDRLSNLIRDPQPGLWSWCNALRKVVEEINRITGVK
jgi:hypothetical protein